MLDIDPADSRRSKGRLQPGRMFLVDTDARPDRRRRGDQGASSPAEHPYDDWLHAGLDPPRGPARARARRAHHGLRRPAASRPSATPRRSCGCCSPRWRAPAPSRSARWAPTPRSRRCRTARGCSSTTSASCSRRSPTRRWTPSARSSSPASATPSAPSQQPARPTPASCRQLVLPFPVIDNDELAKIVHINADGDLPGYRDRDGHAASTGSPAAATALRERARRDLRRGVRRRSRTARGSSCSPTGDSTADLAPIPSLLLTGAVHHHLIREKTRTQVGLVVEAGDVPRGAPRRAAHRLRRRRGQPLPGHGERRGPGPRRRPHRRSTPRRPSRT